MAGITEEYFREQLISRRQRLESALASSRQPESLRQLLNEVDSALERMDAGTYGICEACHESVEKERLLANPFIRYCLDHLTSDQRRSLEQDLELASQIQRELLPKQHVSFGGWEIFYHYEPLGPVSGDFCDVVIREHQSKSLFFVLGDASGKGVAASMLIAQLRAILRTLMETGLPVHELVERASRIFCASTISPYFATLVCGKADLSGEIEICSAGHCPTMILKGGEVKRLEATGLPLGMFSDGRYSAEKIRLTAGDSLFLYTDGLSEARSAADEEYGERRLTELLAERYSLPPRALLQACIEDLASFRSGASPTDDLTVMAIRRAA